MLQLSSPYNFGHYGKNLHRTRQRHATGRLPQRPMSHGPRSEEVIVDELAAAMDMDPVEFRRRHVKEDRSRAVIDKAAELGAGGSECPRVRAGLRVPQGGQVVYGLRRRAGRT